MKILLAASIYPPTPGGPALHAEAFFRYLNENGNEARVVALSDYMRLPKLVRHIAYALRLGKEAFGMDAIYSYDALGVGLPAMLVSWVMRKKFVIRIGGDVLWERDAEKGNEISMMDWYKSGHYKTDPKYKICKFIMYSADELVVPSEILKNLYIKYYEVPDSKVSMIPNPIPEVLIQASNQNEKTIIFASRLVAYKNLGSVLEVMANVFVDHPDLKFLIMGEGPERKGLEDLAGKLKIENNVIFAGTVSQTEVEKRISECLFAIAPALTEFNPNYILQSIALDKPFIISRENGLPFAVPESLIFDPKDKGQMEMRIRRLLDPTEYMKSKEEIANINFHMSWEDVAAENNRILGRLLKA